MVTVLYQYGKKYQKREFNKLTNITLYDEIFKNENTNKTEGWFFGDIIILNIKAIKKLKYGCVTKHVKKLKLII